MLGTRENRVKWSWQGQPVATSFLKPTLGRTNTYGLWMQIVGHAQLKRYGILTVADLMPEAQGTREFRGADKRISVKSNISF